MSTRILITVYSDFPRGADTWVPSSSDGKKWVAFALVVGLGKACWSSWVWHPLGPDGKARGWARGISLTMCKQADTPRSSGFEVGSSTASWFLLACCTADGLLNMSRAPGRFRLWCGPACDCTSGAGYTRQVGEPQAGSFNTPAPGGSSVVVQPATGSLCHPSLPQAPVSRLKAMSAPRPLEKTGAPGAEAEKALSLGIRSDGCPNVLAPGQILSLSPPLQMSASIAESLTWLPKGLLACL